MHKCSDTANRSPLVDADDQISCRKLAEPQKENTQKDVCFLSGQTNELKTHDRAPPGALDVL